MIIFFVGCAGSLISLNNCGAHCDKQTPLSSSNIWEISHAVVTVTNADVAMSSLNRLLIAGDEDTIRDMVNTRNESGQTLLIRTIFIEDTVLRKHTLEALMKVGADIWAADVYGRNALMWACLFRQDSEVSTLLKRAGSCDLLHADIHGNTALHLAVTAGSAASVKNIKNSMLDKSLSIDLENDYGITPGMEAKRLGHDICYSLLMSCVHRGKALQPTPPSRSDSQSSSGDDSSGIGSLGEGSYKYYRRQVSSGASSIASLPPIVSPEVKKRMDCLDSKACWNSSDEDPSSYISQLCKVGTGSKKSTNNNKSRKQQKSAKSVPLPQQCDENLPQIAMSRRPHESVTLSKSSHQSMLNQSLAERLPEINLTDSIVCMRR